MRVVEEHNCKAIENCKSIAIQLLVLDENGKAVPQGWYWIDWAVKRPVAEEISYCPYCGKKLKY